MKLSEVKNILTTAAAINFKLPDGTLVPEHFHITEVGLITKNFIDCGGTVRKESVVNFQLLDANDYEHRLKPGKLLNIISLSEKILGLEDNDVEVEYQHGTIGKYGLDYKGFEFILTNKNTACLANDQCGIPTETSNPTITSASCCAPGQCC